MHYTLQQQEGFSHDNSFSLNFDIVFLTRFSN